MSDDAEPSVKDAYGSGRTWAVRLVGFGLFAGSVWGTASALGAGLTSGWGLTSVPLLAGIVFAVMSEVLLASAPDGVVIETDVFGTVRRLFGQLFAGTVMCGLLWTSVVAVGGLTVSQAVYWGFAVGALLFWVLDEAVVNRDNVRLTRVESGSMSSRTRQHSGTVADSHSIRDNHATDEEREGGPEMSVELEGGAPPATSRANDEVPGQASTGGPDDSTPTATAAGSTDDTDPGQASSGEPDVSPAWIETVEEQLDDEHWRDAVSELKRAAETAEIAEESPWRESFDLAYRRLHSLEGEGEVDRTEIGSSLVWSR